MQRIGPCLAGSSSDASSVPSEPLDHGSSSTLENIYSSQERRPRPFRKAIGDPWKKNDNSQTLLPYSTVAFQEDCNKFSSLLDIGTRQYWTRLWIVQELFVAQDVVVLHPKGYLALQALLHFAQGFAGDLVQLRDDVGARWAAKIRTFCQCCAYCQT